MDKLLKILESNARLDNKKIAAMLGETEEAVQAAIEAYEAQGVICGYKTIIDWDKTDRHYVIARIELKVQPKRDMGFEEIANRIAQLEEVESVFLMSGGYDLALTVSGKTFKDVAMFVAHRLAPLESIQSTATHFVLRKYKERGLILSDESRQDEREDSTL